MIRFYFNFAPNPMKVALLLEETSMAYEAIPIDTLKGEQLTPTYLVINPNGKLPSIIDDAQVIFDSNAILLYLAEKADQFLPGNKDRGQLLSWLMFVASGVGPFSGQAVHFRHHAPDPDEYALNRYNYEAERHWTIVERQLQAHSYMVGNTYTIVDMAVWGWARLIPHMMGDDRAWEKFPNVHRLVQEISARSAAQRVKALRQQFKFKTEMDEEARRYMFPQLSRLRSAQR